MNNNNEIISLLKAIDEKLSILLKSSSDYSTQQFAKLVGLKTDTIREYCSKGKLQAKQVAKGRWRISKEELARYRQQGLL